LFILGGEINEIKVAPRSTSLLFSASNDGSIRLWNIATKNLICIFGGVDGHRDSVISLDTHLLGGCIASGGIDHSIKIWRYDTPEIRSAIARSCSEVFKGLRVQYPDFSTREVHRNYVDGLRFFGDLLISKSTDDPIKIWKPGKLDTPLLDLKDSREKSVTIFHEFPLNESDIFSIRLEYGGAKDYLAVGDQEGRVFVWPLNVDDPAESKYTILEHPDCKEPVRQVAFSRDNNVLVAVNDDGRIWRWDFQAENLI
jgi:polycomb protein EED